jgi:uncharacterized repeat protein (TIGR01451 family)
MSRSARLFISLFTGLALIAWLLTLADLAKLTPQAQARPAWQTLGCQARPIAFHVSILTGLQPGDPTGNVYYGTGVGDFGWLRWTDDTALPMNSNSEEYLAAALLDPSLAAIEFQEAYQPPLCTDSNDDLLNAGDCVWSLTGNVNSSGVAHAALESLMGQEIRVLVWDQAQGSGSSVAYRILRFAKVRLTGHDMAGNPKTLWAEFVGWDDDACPELYPDLVIAKSVRPDRVQPEERLTYTLAFSNAGQSLATGVVISDALPSILTEISFINTGASITPVAGITYTWQVGDLAPNEGGRITLTARLPANLPTSHVITNTATITGTRPEITTVNNINAVIVSSIERIYVPVILKQPGLLAEHHHPKPRLELDRKHRILNWSPSPGMSFASASSVASRRSSVLVQPGVPIAEKKPPVCSVCTKTILN